MGIPMSEIQFFDRARLHRHVMYTRLVESVSSAGSRLIAILLAILLVSAAQVQGADAEDEAKASPSTPLSLDDVVDNLVRRNAERTRNLLHSEATRVYHLTYRGFPSNREAEMTVEAVYDSPSSKEFKVLSQSGSKIIIDRVFGKLLEAEKEATRPEMASQTLLNRDNYKFELIAHDAAAGQYELQVTPKHKNKYVYRGKIWVDATDFAVTRIDAEPAQNPSLWTRKSEIHHEYQKIHETWVPKRNESISYIRLGGGATLTIQYKNYHVVEARPDTTAMSPSAAD